MSGRGPPTAIVESFHLFRPNLEFCRFERVRAVISIEPFGAGTFNRVRLFTPKPTRQPRRSVARASVPTRHWSLDFEFRRGELGGEVAEPKWVAELDAGMEAVEQLERVFDFRF